MQSIIGLFRKTRNIIFGLLGLSLVIVVHEFGHFIACKLFGVGTPVFSIGFGPQLIGYKIGATVFQIALLPLGGYVQIAIKDLAKQPYIFKMIIMLAGIAFNFLFAFIIFLYLASRGKQQVLPIIKIIFPNSPAQNAGLQSGDTLLAIDGMPIEENASDFVRLILQSPGKNVMLTIERSGSTYDVPVTFADTHPTFGNNMGWLGVSFEKIRIKPVSWKYGIKQGLTGMNDVLIQFGSTLALLFRKKNYGGTTGPIGIIALMSQSFGFGIYFYWYILAILSINVGFFNLLPLPFFDGGQVVHYTIEALYGPLPSKFINLVYLIFLMLLIYFIFSISIKDIRRLRRK